MKILLMLFMLIAFVWCEKYTTKYDNIDIDEILSSERLLKNYFNCLMDRGPCTPEGAELRKDLPEALETDCAKCSEKQKEATKKIVRFLINNKKDMWKELSAKYDPDGSYYEKHKDELN